MFASLILNLRKISLNSWPFTKENHSRTLPPPLNCGFVKPKLQKKENYLKKRLFYTHKSGINYSISLTYSSWNSSIFQAFSYSSLLTSSKPYFTFSPYDLYPWLVLPLPLFLFVLLHFLFLSFIPILFA